MAQTKQTPRNPNMGRPPATMGGDVQERRAPTKPSSKHIATKGGKQPHKHMLPSYSKETHLLVELRNHTDTTQDCWPYVKYIDINNLLKA